MGVNEENSFQGYMIKVCGDDERKKNKIPNRVDKEKGENKRRKEKDQRRTTEICSSLGVSEEI